MLCESGGEPRAPTAPESRPARTAYDDKYFGIDVPDEVEMIAQQRAYTSPIWYTP